MSMENMLHLEQVCTRSQMRCITDRASAVHDAVVADQIARDAHGVVQTALGLINYTRTRQAQ